MASNGGEAETSGFNTSTPWPNRSATSCLTNVDAKALDQNGNECSCISNSITIHLKTVVLRVSCVFYDVLYL